MAIFYIKICMIGFLKDWMSSISSDLYEEILKPSKSHTNRIIQIVPCKTALLQLEKDLYRRIYKRERFVKIFCSNWRHEITYSFLCKQLYLAQLNLEKAIFKPENKTICSMNYHLWCLKFMEYCVQELKKHSWRKAKEVQVAVSRKKGREITTFCLIICEFSIFLCCFLQW